MGDELKALGGPRVGRTLLSAAFDLAFERRPRNYWRVPHVSPPLRDVGFHIPACHAERSCRAQRERQRSRSTPYQHV